MTRQLCIVHMSVVALLSRHVTQKQVLTSLSYGQIFFFSFTPNPYKASSYAFLFFFLTAAQHAMLRFRPVLD